MRGLEPRRTSYAGAAVELFPERRRFKKGGTSAPPSANPSAVAGAQLNANIGTAQAQSALNNVRTTSPLGTSFFEQGPDGRWSLNQTLDPSTAPVYGAQTGLAATLAQQAQGGAPWVASGAQGGGTLIDQALRNIGPAALNPAPTLQRNLDFSSLGPLPNPNPADFTRSLDFTGLEKLPTSSQDFGRAVTDAQNAAYNTQAGYLDPQFAQKGSDLRQQLADEGIGVGTQAYSRAQGDLGRQSTLAYQQAQDAAVAAGQAEQQRLFGEALSGRQQGKRGADLGAVPQPDQPIDPRRSARFESAGGERDRAGGSVCQYGGAAGLARPSDGARLACRDGNWDHGKRRIEPGDAQSAFGV
jgi:hypothetical protein